MRSRTLIATVVMVLAAAVQHAQQKPQFRAGVEYVEVDARVVDDNGEPIRNLVQQDFQVFEDGVRQELKTFSIVDLLEGATVATLAERVAEQLPSEDTVADLVTEIERLSTDDVRALLTEEGVR